MSIIYSISFASNLKIYEEIFESKREVYSRREHNPVRGSDGMADMGDSKSPGKIHAGSSPVFPTRAEKFLLLPIRQAVRHKGGLEVV